MSIDTDELDERGYTTTPLLDEAALEALRARWDTLAVAEDTAYFTTNVHADRSTARAIDLELKAVAGPAIGEVLPGYTPFLAAFITKGAHGGAVDVHPDWTYTDERRHRTYLIWCPLVDADETNGTLGVVPGSHRWLHGLRGSGDFPPVVAEAADVVADRFVTVPLRAGEAILYDAALLHGSPPNTSDRPRPALAVAMAPTGAALVHFHRPVGGPTHGFSIDDAWYTVQAFGEPPSGYPALEPWAEPLAPLTREQVRSAH